MSDDPHVQAHGPFPGAPFTLPREHTMSKEENLLAHMQHHNVKEWLLRGARDEDANTIRNAIEAIPEHRLIRRLARALAKE
jgi:hypothetical protein